MAVNVLSSSVENTLNFFSGQVLCHVHYSLACLCQTSHSLFHIQGLTLNNNTNGSRLFYLFV